ncbi:MAG: hypothetical protein ACR652_26150 [Methylocystis sp.]|uniref:hypothetical protein n=1 Tax=Methylocystis sp. TaxID=1911079 RepID=UPI003DA5CCF7
MQDIIFSAPSADFLASEARRLGFVDSTGAMVVTGSFENGSGSWFLNIIGADNLPAFNAEITQ